jgi:hypothetical protein
VIGKSWLLAGLCALLLQAYAPPCGAEPPANGKRGRVSAGAKKQRKARPKRARSSSESKRARDVAEPKRPASGKPERAEPGDDKRAEPAAPRTAVRSGQKSAQDAAQGANAEIVKEGDTSVKMMTFSGLDIEARLKSPQLLYFVNRVHAEFDRPKLPHRSFMPELERSTEQEPVR